MVFPKSRSFSFIARNIGFLVKNVPFADRKAEAHFKRAIEVARAIGAKSLLGQVKFDLGLLHHAKKRPEQARQCIHEAILLFEECRAEAFAERAKNALSDLPLSA
jgi:tetratricopeptide (TPR) repeat protein